MWVIKPTGLDQTTILIQEGEGEENKKYNTQNGLKTDKNNKMPRGQSTIERMNATSRIGTYNIHGKLERDMREHEYTLLHDMKRLKIQVLPRNQDVRKL